VETFAEVLAPHGRTTDQRHGYGHRVPPNKWLAMTAPDVVREAIGAHHAALGLNPPKDELMHLHPEGHPGTTDYAPVPTMEPVALPPEHAAWVQEYCQRTKRLEVYGPEEQS
jgi:hypothetical protein